MKNLGFFVCSAAVFMALLTCNCSPEMPVSTMEEAAAPVLLAMSPALGPTAGGIEITLEGENFVAGTKITVDGAEVTQATVVSTHRITAMLPKRPGQWGQVPVVVTNPDGKAASRKDLFAYYASELAFSGSVYVVGRNPESIAVDDFNGDQKLDLAVINTGKNSVGVFLGNGMGGFSTAPSVYVGKEPSEVVVGDFNGDGKRDLAVANHYQNVVVLLGNGLGAFKWATEFTLTEEPSRLAVADFNFDEKLDLVVITRSSRRDNVCVLFGDGAGGFSSGNCLAIGTRLMDVVVADFNGDQRPDFAISSYDDNLYVVLIDAQGGYRTVSTQLGSGSMPNGMAVGDFNKDSISDIAVGLYFKDSVAVLLGDGQGGFSAIPNLAADKNPQSIAVGDFNGDENLDLAVTNLYGNDVSLFLGNGMGAFNVAPSLIVSQFPWSMSVGDFNGDRKLDLVVGSGDYGATTDLSSLSIWLNQSR